MLKIPFPSLYISNFSEGDTPGTPAPPPLRTLPNKPVSPALVFSAPAPPLAPTAIEIAPRRPCVYSHPLPSEKKREKGG